MWEILHLVGRDPYVAARLATLSSEYRREYLAVATRAHFVAVKWARRWRFRVIRRRVSNAVGQAMVYARAHQDFGRALEHWTARGDGMHEIHCFRYEAYEVDGVKVQNDVGIWMSVNTYEGDELEVYEYFEHGPNHPEDHIHVEIEVGDIPESRAFVIDGPYCEFLDKTFTVIEPDWPFFHWSTVVCVCIYEELKKYDLEMSGISYLNKLTHDGSFDMYSNYRAMCKES